MSVLCENTIIGASAAAATGYTIDQSLRFNDDDSAYLSRTPASAGNRKTWTWSGWVKRGNIGTNNFYTLFSAGPYTGSSAHLSFYNGGGKNDVLSFYQYNAGYQIFYETSASYRDVGGYYHVVLAIDTTQSTASERVKIYVNGTQVTSFVTSTAPSQNLDTYVNSSSEVHYQGNTSRAQLSDALDGYLSEVHFIDGQALTPSDFGETDDTYGHWKAKEYTGTYGTNGFYLPFDSVDDTIISATGGTVTTDGDYKVHTFNSSGTFTVNSASGASIVEYLVIAGGGGGGSEYYAGGGGAGGYQTAAAHSVTTQAYSITVGAGGAGVTGSTATKGNNGSNSSFDTITSTGGGGGGERGGVTGNTGGSGGGASSWVGTSPSGASGTAGQGNAGAKGYSGGGNPHGSGGGGGGGAGTAAVDRTSYSSDGHGGDGASSSITGSAVTRAGGGGAGGYGSSPTFSGTGGSGGGGKGADNSSDSTAGSVNTGSGGGGGDANSPNSGDSGAGGSGVVIIRYKFQ